jgi:3-oxoacyl-[acyl-carrier-protein] synthase II
VKRRVVVTGLGILSAIGDGVETFWTNLCAGRTGIGRLTRFDPADMRSPLAASAVPFEEDVPEGTTLTDKMAIHAAREALSDAGLENLPDGAGVAIGTGVSGLPESEDVWLAHLEGQRLSKGLRAFTRHLPATMADVLAKRFGATGPVQSVVNACSSSTVSIGSGWLWIASGETDMVLAGASDALSRLTVGGFNIIRVVTRDTPRPFDKDRSGMAVGEGAAFLILESEESARRRGAPIYALVEGMGMSTDAYHVTAPQPEGLGALAAMRAALNEADLGPEDVDHINAHGTGTGPNDKAEAKAIETLLGERTPQVPVVSIKGSIGHCLGAAGALEAVATVLAIRHQMVPPNAGFRELIPESALSVSARPREASIDHAISVSLAFGGNNAALVFGRLS